MGPRNGGLWIKEYPLTQPGQLCLADELPFMGPRVMAALTGCATNKLNLAWAPRHPPPLVPVPSPSSFVARYFGTVPHCIRSSLIPAPFF